MQWHASTLSIHDEENGESCSVILLMQAFDADLLVADPGNLGGWALADALDIHKAIVQVPGFTPPLVRHVHTLHHHHQ